MQPPTLRWWDGSTWSGHVHPMPYAQPGGKATTTPDGQELAGWGVRLGAFLIDSVITSFVAALLALPFIVPLVHAYGDFFRRALDASRVGARPPSSLSLWLANLGPVTGIYVVIAVVNLVYHVGFLRTKAATPGKLMLGLRVRLRETPGPLAWGTIGRRSVAQFGVLVLAVIPLVGSVGGLYQWLDDLWPLWDDRRQALHDKFARTNVVRVR